MFNLKMKQERRQVLRKKIEKEKSPGEKRKNVTLFDHLELLLTPELSCFAQGFFLKLIEKPSDGVPSISTGSPLKRFFEGSPSLGFPNIISLT